MVSERDNRFLKYVHHLHHVAAIIAFQSSLSSVLLMSSLLGDSFLVSKLLRLSVYFVRCLPLLLIPQIFPPNLCFSSTSAQFVCRKNCSCRFLMVFIRIFCILPFPLLFLLTSFQSMIFSLFF